MTEQTGNNKPNEAEALAFPLSGNEKLIESVRDWPTITRMSHSTQLEKLVELRDALEAAGKALTPTDDERAIFDAIADRLGEHSQATNYEIADSGEYETKLRGPVDVEVLAEWLLPTVLGFRRSEVLPEPSTECPQCHRPDGLHKLGCGERFGSEPQGEPSSEVPEPSTDDRDPITDENLWDFADDLLDAWNIEDANAPSLAEDFRDRFVARFHPAYRPEPQGEPSSAQLKAGAQEYAAQRYREVIYLSEYNAAVSAFVEGAEWARAAGGVR